MKMSKLSILFVLALTLAACSNEPDPKLEAQKRLEAEAKEIQTKAIARKEFKDKHCKGKSTLECKKLMEEAGLSGKGEKLY